MLATRVLFPRVSQRQSQLPELKTTVSVGLPVTQMARQASSHLPVSNMFQSIVVINDKCCANERHRADRRSLGAVNLLYLLTMQRYVLVIMVAKHALRLGEGV